jgi:hypothetical protein
MNQQRLLRKDIEYLLNKTSFLKGLEILNGDITRFNKFNVPTALIGVKPTQKTEKNVNDKQQLKYRVDVTIIFAKLPENCDLGSVSELYDEEINRMSQAIDNIHLGLTERYVDLSETERRKENPIAHKRGYETDGALEFTNSWFAWGSNKYMKLDAVFTITMPYKRCLDCNSFEDGTFDDLPLH